jgi:mannan endo-1,4-beta-mannosidase
MRHGAARRGRISRISTVLAAVMLIGSVLAGCSVVRAAGTWSDPRHAVAGSGAKGAAPAPTGASASSGAAGASAPLAPAYNVAPLIKPSRKYLGVEINGAPASLTPAKQFASWVGTKPNLIGQYVAWGTSFDTAAASNAWSYGAMDFVVWEPWDTTLSKIAAGDSDAYITQFATAVRNLNVPIALSFGHEFNGNWYPWGTTGTTAADFVAAWKHVHDLFAQAGATNVIWIWDPNDIYPVPNVSLQQYYPGDSYVDWVGVTGYWTQPGPNTYASLYLPTLEEIRTFTEKPFIIAETSVAAGSNEEQSLQDLFEAVEQHSDIIGFVWYDYNKGGDWRIENRPTLLTDFQQQLATGDFGFTVSGVK